MGKYLRYFIWSIFYFRFMQRLEKIIRIQKLFTLEYVLSSAMASARLSQFWSILMHVYVTEDHNIPLFNTSLIIDMMPIKLINLFGSFYGKLIFLSQKQLICDLADLIYFHSSTLVWWFLVTRNFQDWEQFIRVFHVQPFILLFSTFPNLC